MGGPVVAIAGDHPVRHDRALAAPGQGAGGRPDNVNIRRRDIRHETGQAFVVPKAALRLAEQMQRRIEAARYAEQITFDLASRPVSDQRGDAAGPKAPTQPSPASGGVTACDAG